MAPNTPDSPRSPYETDAEAPDDPGPRCRVCAAIATAL